MPPVLALTYPTPRTHARARAHTGPAGLGLGWAGLGFGALLCSMGSRKGVASTPLTPSRPAAPPRIGKPIEGGECALGAPM
jgi:hypothetical protein